MGLKNFPLPPEEELEEEFVRCASGPGGQNVNKTATAVRLIWHFTDGVFLTDQQKERLKEMTGGHDFISILARESRSLPDNRRIARERLSAFVIEARKQQKKRKATKPTKASQRRRLEAKARQSRRKAERRASWD